MKQLSAPIENNYTSNNPNTANAAESPKQKAPAAVHMPRRSSKPLTRPANGPAPSQCDIAMLPLWIRTGFSKIKRIERNYEDIVTDEDGRVTRPMTTTVGIEIQHGSLEVGVFNDADFDYHRGTPNSRLLMEVLRNFMFKAVRSRWYRAEDHEQEMRKYQKLCAIAKQEWGVNAAEPFVSSSFADRDGK